MSELTKKLEKLVKNSELSEKVNTDEVVHVIYPVLIKIAQGIRRQKWHVSNTLDTVALVNETWMKLDRFGFQGEDLEHFYCLAAKMMRQISINEFKKKQTQKRQGNHCTYDDHLNSAYTEHFHIEVNIQMEEILNSLESQNKRLANVFHMRFFLGLNEAEIAEILNINIRTVRRDWATVKTVVLKTLE